MVASCRARRRTVRGCTWRIAATSAGVRYLAVLLGCGLVTASALGVPSDASALHQVDVPLLRVAPGLLGLELRASQLAVCGSRLPRTSASMPASLGRSALCLQHSHSRYDSAVPARKRTCAFWDKFRSQRGQSEFKSSLSRPRGVAAVNHVRRPTRERPDP